MTQLSLLDAARPEASGDYLRDLLGKDFTAEQMAIITADLEPQLVIAGAGSGKTMVMAARVVHAVAFHGLSPGRILGLTFTNKAAGELAERVRRSLARLPRPDDPAASVDVDDTPTIATYHSYSAQIVRDHALRIGREPGATLLTEAVQWQLALRVAMRAPGPFEHLPWMTATVATHIVSLAGDLSEHLATAADVCAHDARVLAAVRVLPKRLKPVKEMVEKIESREELLALVAAYTTEKERLDLIDFGDQVALACAIARTAPEVAAIERDRYQLVVLDEYQDTGVAQRVLLSSLFAGSHAVTAVGDPNQAIYGWRGASASNLSRFGEHFAAGGRPVVPQPLMTSFRCAGRILEAANVVAAPLAASLQAKGRVRIDLPELRPTAAAASAGEVVVERLETAGEEAAALAERISAALSPARPRAREAVQPREIAVLARRRTDFARLHQAMVERGIPVEVVGLGGLLAMPEVSDLVAVLSLVADGTSNAAAVRLLSGPRWRLGVRDLAALGRRAAYLVRPNRSPTDDDPQTRTQTETDSAPPADRPTERDLDREDEGPAVSDGLDAVLQAATASVDPVEVPSLLEAAESPGRSSGCSAEALQRLARFVAEIRRFRALAGQPLVDLITEVIRTTGLDVEIEAGDLALAEARMANVDAFLDVAAQFSGLDGEADLSAFLAYLRAASENEDGLDIGSVSEANTVKLMTVHAAKGLEWDIVAVPGLVATVFPSTRGRSSWMTGAQVLPFDCRGDAADLPVLRGFATKDIDAFREECRSDAQDEERRLAYVALTRARRTLWLSAYVWSPTRKDFCPPSSFLEEVAALGEPTVGRGRWAPDPEPGTANPLLAVGVADVTWPAAPEPEEMDRRRAAAAQVTRALTGGSHGADEAAGLGGTDAATAARWDRDAGLLVEEIRRARTTVIDVAMPARLTTSQIVALARDEADFAASLARPVPTAPASQARRGSRFHLWVEQLYSVAPLLEPDDLPGAEDADLADEELAALQARFLADGWGERRPVAVEAPFETVIGGRLVRGRIDAVYRDDEGYDVIDYKTGSVPTGPTFQAAAHQLSVYRLAWADLAGVDPAQVRAGFLYVRDGILKRPDRLLDRAELAALIGGSPPKPASSSV